MLTVTNLSKHYKNSTKGIDNISFEINKGEILCVAGPNGSGKTTLINSMLGFIKKDSGKVILNQNELIKLEVKKRIAYVPDETILIEELSGMEYLEFIQKIIGEIQYAKIQQLITLFDMDEDIFKPIASYSHGMKKKVQLISSFMMEFDLIILDEPCRGLDIESIYILKRLLKMVRDSKNMIFVSSHDLLFAEKICSKMIILLHGKMIDSGRIEYLKEKFNSTSIEEVFLKAVMTNKRGKEIENLLRNFENDL
ncbi:MAG: ABC transporter ATP-binding protein [Lactobacillales bacterium]|nr:ABC transporter ATP-binding protein [Lactobacillales bacterium]